MVKLDLGCGQKRKDGFVGVDRIPMPGVDVVWDLERVPWPFEADSVDDVYASHYVEHTRDLIAFMDEVYRICKAGARVVFVHPYYTSVQAWQDPTHTRVLSEHTWGYFDSAWRAQAGLTFYPIAANFTVKKVQYSFYEEFRNKPRQELQFAMQHYWNVVADMVVELEAVKPATG